jgi:hypothetical protein
MQLRAALTQLRASLLIQATHRSVPSVSIPQGLLKAIIQVPNHYLHIKASIESKLEVDSHSFLRFVIKGVVMHMLLIMSNLHKIMIAYFLPGRKNLISYTINLNKWSNRQQPSISTTEATTLSHPTVSCSTPERRKSSMCSTMIKGLSSTTLQQGWVLHHSSVNSKLIRYPGYHALGAYWSKYLWTRGSNSLYCATLIISYVILIHQWCLILIKRCWREPHALPLSLI